MSESIFRSFNLTGEKSTVNSSSSALSENGATGGADTFTGTAEQNDFTDVMVSVKTDQKGTLYMEFSPDGTNWDSSLSFKYDPTKINVPHVLVKGSRYYRTRFVNDGTSAQTFFRLQTDYGHFQKLTAAINGTLAQTYDAIVTRPTNFFQEVKEGKRQGNIDFTKFGYTDISSADTELTAWSYNTGTFTPMTTAESLTIVSDNTNDDLVGTGAQKIKITGIDANREAQEVTYDMDGTNDVVTAETWLGVNRAQIVQAGSGETNVGNITITDSSTGGTVQGYIKAGDAYTQQLIFHVPSTADAYLWEWFFEGTTTSGNQDAKYTITIYVITDGVKSKPRIFKLDTANNPAIDRTFVVPFRVPAGSIWYVNVESTLTGTFLEGDVEQILIDN